jgi:hypothetical protein
MKTDKLTKGFEEIMESMGVKFIDVTPDRPICSTCGKPMELATDPIAKKITGYLWYCKCSPKTLLSVG